MNKLKLFLGRHGLFPLGREDLQSPYPDIRELAAQALARQGDDAGIEVLFLSLKESTARRRYEAAQLLGRLRNPRALEPLIAALYDPDEWVRTGAAEALGKLGDPRAVEPLIELMLDPKRQETPDGDGDVTAAEQFAIMAIGPAGLPALLNHLDSRFCLYVIRRFGDPRATEGLLAALYATPYLPGKSSGEAWHYLNALQYVADAQILPALEEYAARYPAARTVIEKIEFGKKEFAWCPGL